MTALLFSFEGNTQCIDLNSTYPGGWNDEIVVLSQSGTIYTLEYEICNPTTDDWTASSVNIQVTGTGFSPAGPDPISTSYGDLDEGSSGWSGSIDLPAGECYTFTFDIDGPTWPAPGDISLDILAFDPTFTTCYEGIADVECLPFLIINQDYINSTKTEKASDINYTGNIINSNITFEAGTILLQPNTEIQLGSTFETIITICN